MDNLNIKSVVSFLVLYILLALGLTACGGSGSDSDSSGSTDTPEGAPSYIIGVGYLIDSPVIGIAYSCSPSAKSGNTTSEGQFNYTDGDICTFSVGDISLPPVTASTLITVLDLANATKTTDRAAVNIAVFLQSLDDNADISTAITITPQRISQLTGLSNPSIDFNSVTELSDVMSEAGVALVSEADAIAHLTAELANIGNIDDTPGIIAETTITVDGSNADWAGIVPVMVDAAGDQIGSSATDFISLSAVTDGIKMAILFQTTGPITKPHSPSTDHMDPSYSHYSVGIHSFSDDNCQTKNGAVIVTDLSDESSSNSQLEIWNNNFTDFEVALTSTAYNGSYLETSFNKSDIPAGTRSIHFNPSVDTSATVNTSNDSVSGDSKKCFTFVN